MANTNVPTRAAAWPKILICFIGLLLWFENQQRQDAARRIKNWMVDANPSAKLLTGVKPAARSLSIAATECFTSPARSGACWIADFDPVSAQILCARSLMVLFSP